MIAESTGVAHVEEPVASTGAEDSTLQTLMAEPSTLKSVPVVVISEATTVIISEVPVTTSALKEVTAGHVPALSEMVFASMETIRMIIERESISAST